MKEGRLVCPEKIIPSDRFYRTTCRYCKNYGAYQKIFLKNRDPISFSSESLLRYEIDIIMVLMECSIINRDKSYRSCNASPADNSPQHWLLCTGFSFLLISVQQFRFSETQLPIPQLNPSGTKVAIKKCFLFNKIFCIKRH